MGVVNFRPKKIELMATLIVVLFVFSSGGYYGDAQTNVNLDEIGIDAFDYNSIPNNPF